VANAVLANATLAHGLDFDDTREDRGNAAIALPEGHADRIIRSVHALAGGGSLAALIEALTVEDAHA
jgi:hypothetical protein